MKSIYLDEKQCAQFKVPYTGPASVVVRARDLLESKGGDGYDATHRKYLGGFDSLTRLTLTRVVDDGNDPGWFTPSVDPDLKKETDAMWKAAFKAYS